MAAEESINEFVSQAALKQLDDLKIKIDASAKSMEVLISQTLSYNNEIAKASNLNDYAKAVDNSKKATQSLTAEQKAFIQTFNAYESALTKLTAAQSNEAKELANIQVQLAEVNKANRDAAKSANEQIDAYTKLVRAQKAAEKEYLNLAASQGIDSEAAKKAAAANKILHDELTKIEQGGGNFKRNVGNYTSGFFSFTQVLREAPAFANSFNTGVMALSNNIPMLADELKRAREAGASIGQIFKGLGATLFSFGGIVTIATTLLTFLPKIMSAIGESADESTKKIKSFSEVQAEAAKSAQKEASELEALVIVATADNKTRDEKRAAIKKINDIMPDYLGNITEENIKTKEGVAIIQQYISTIQARALAQAYLAKIQDLYVKKIDIQNSAIKENITLTDKLSEVESFLFGAEGQAKLNLQKQGIENRKASAKAIDDELIGLKALFKQDLLSGKAILDLDKIEKNRTERKKKEKKDRNQDLLDEQAGLKHEYEMQLAFAKEQDELEKEYNDIALKRKKEAVDAMIKEHKRLAEEQEDIDKKEAARIKANIEFNKNARIELVRTIASSLNSIFAGGIDKQKNAIQDQIDMNDRLRESEIERISQSVGSEQDKADKIAVINAKSQAQKENLERKQKELDQKKAVADKANAIFEIILNTGVAVSKQLGFGNITGALLVGAIGSAQLATVLARPIPKFAKGTDNAPEGIAWVGEQGRELIITPSGQVSFTPETATLTYLEKGSKVIPNHKLNGMALDGLAGITRYNSNSSDDYKILAKATLESADKITRAIKNQPGIQITEGGLYLQHQKAQRLENYLKRNLR